MGKLFSTFYIKIKLLLLGESLTVGIKPNIICIENELAELGGSDLKTLTDLLQYLHNEHLIII